MASIILSAVIGVIVQCLPMQLERATEIIHNLVTGAVNELRPLGPIAQSLSGMAYALFDARCPDDLDVRQSVSRV